MKSLLFIPDISGFTEFVQTTDVEHSRYVISQLLETLIDANTLGLKLSEIEGDALFFYLENRIPTKDELMEQIEVMNIAFYKHLELLKSHRKCPCVACTNMDNLQLKIVAHSAELSFIKVQKRIKPFGIEVIEIHRLLKNSIDNNNYILISEQLAHDMKISKNYEDSLIKLEKGKEYYDGKEIHYLYSSINTGNLVKNLSIKRSFKEAPVIEFNFLQWIKRVFSPINTYSYN